MNSHAEYIQAAALFALAGTGSFLRESAAMATLDINSAALPVIVLADYTTTQLNENSKVQAAALTIWFGDATPGPGDDAAARHVTETRMSRLKDRLLAALSAEPLTERLNEKASGMPSMFEAMLDGIGCQFTLTVPPGSLPLACLPGAIVVPPVPLAPRITNFVVTGDAPIPLAPLISNLTAVAA